MTASKLLADKAALDLSTAEERNMRAKLEGEHPANRHGRRLADRKMRKWLASRRKKVSEKATAP